MVMKFIGYNFFVYLGLYENVVCNGIRMSMFSIYVCLLDIFGVEIKWKCRVDLKDWFVIKKIFILYYFLVFWYVDNLFIIVYILIVSLIF